MTENEDKLLEQFFQEAAGMQLPDDGFTERVMSSLPTTSSQPMFRRSHQWTLFCVVVFAVLFVVLHGWEALKTAFEVFLCTAPTEFNPAMLVAVGLGLAIATITELGYASHRYI